MRLKGKDVVVGVTGGIAAYKACELVSRLVKEGASVYVVMTANAARFVEKFAALYMATAEMATEALGIEFDMEGLLKFLKEYDQTEGPSRNTSLESYREILDYCATHPDEFIQQDLTPNKKINDYSTILNSPMRVCYGRIKHMNKVLPDGRVLVREYELYPYFVDRMLRINNHSNKDTCVQAWIEAGVLDIEDPTHVRKKRSIGRNASTRVYVLQEFADDEDAARIIAELAAEEAKSKAVKKNSQMKKLTPTITRGGKASA